MGWRGDGCSGWDFGGFSRVVNEGFGYGASGWKLLLRPGHQEVLGVKRGRLHGSLGFVVV